jgi:hypothetical protein
MAAGVERNVRAGRARSLHLSYNKADLDWAEWIVQQLEAVGYSTIYRHRDFRPGRIS